MDTFLSRDLDCVPSMRETAAVSEFLNDPDAQFHVMRDHPQHAAPILGGTWGAKVNDETREELSARMGKVMQVNMITTLWATRKESGREITGDYFHLTLRLPPYVQI